VCAYGKAEELSIERRDELVHIVAFVMTAQQCVIVRFARNILAVM